jgi:cytochrome b
METAMPDNAPKPGVYVWDAPTRLFHWSIVVLIFVSWLSADQGYMKVHLWSGLTLLVLLLFRIGWGFAGATTARFSNFLHSPGRVMAYVKTVLGEERQLHAGHNPAGGLMVAVLLLALLAQALTGLVANDGLKFSGPLALQVSVDQSDQLTQIHGAIFNFMLVLIWLHLVAIGFYLLVKGENLVGPMVTGKKHHAHVPEGVALVFTRPVIALALLALSAACAAWILL